MKLIDLTNQKFGEWTVLKYVGDKKWLCRCSCGNIREVNALSLRQGRSTSCNDRVKHPNKSPDKAFKDLTGQQFGVLTVLNYVGESRWRCKCVCGQEVELLSKNIRNHKHDKCTHINKAKKIEIKPKPKKIKEKKPDILINNTVGDLSVLRKVADDRYFCRCKCGLEKEVAGYSLRKALREGQGYECRHANVINKRFGKLTVVQRLPNQICRCKCDCGGTKDVWIGNLLNRSTMSCGCLKSRKYNKEQTLQIINNYIQNTGEKPFTADLAELLGLGLTAVYEYIEEYNLQPYMNQQFGSKAEKDIWLFVTSMIEAEHHNRTILNGRELDIYIPEKKIAIEFNGNYWHSYPNKSKTYHQEKTIDCAKQGIRLIHIFEYEWGNKNTRDKIKQLLKNVIIGKSNILYAINLTICEPSVTETKEFENKYCIQGYANDNIRIGLKHGNTLIGVMTFGKLRFNSNYQYELIRLCYISDTEVVGGSEKMLKYFLSKHDIKNIVTYIDIAKFTGNSYTKLGFKTTKNPIIEPSYIWVDTHNNIMKHKLIKDEPKIDEQTEEEMIIMNNYFKVYNSGNIKLLYKNNK